jgi:hypothetical protein
VRDRLAVEKRPSRQQLVQDHAKAQMSARRSTGLPAACSGDMYAAVPRITPACVIVSDIVGLLAAFGAASSVAFASQKSSSFTTPSAVTLIFAGLRSR